MSAWDIGHNDPSILRAAPFHYKTGVSFGSGIFTDPMHLAIIGAAAVAVALILTRGKRRRK